jgi:protein ImuB
MKRVMCLWFPNWPVQWRNAERADKGRALVVYGPAGRGQVRVVACSRAARRWGVRVAMLLAEAQSFWPSSAGNAARFEAHDPLADRRRLRELAVWCQRLSPSVGIDDADSPDGLVLDATGCGPGFGGEQGLAEKAVAGLAGRGYWAAAAVADTVGTAWAVARHAAVKRGASSPVGSRMAIVPPGGNADALRPLPVEALRLPGPIVQVLHELNVVRIDELLAMPRASLPARFGPELLWWIDRALGLVPEPFTPEEAVESPEASWEFEPPVPDDRVLTAVIGELLERLFKRLPREHGFQRLLCSLKPAGHDPIHFPVELLRPSASVRNLLDLVRLRIERLRLPAEVSGVTVRAASVVPLDFQQGDLFGRCGVSTGGNEVTGLLERLSSRLGERAVLRPRLWADAQPEMACQYAPWLSDVAHAPPCADNRPAVPLTRPTWLKDRPVAIRVDSAGSGGAPERVRWGERDHSVQRAWGPERVETGWWRGEDVRRDYYAVETATGERLWLFRDLADGSWFLHGVFA